MLTDYKLLETFNESSRTCQKLRRGPINMSEFNYKIIDTCKWVVWEVLSKGELLPHEVILRGYY